MNFYNPYMNMNPTSMGISNSGLFGRLAGVKGGFNWSSLYFIIKRILKRKYERTFIWI